MAFKKIVNDKAFWKSVAIMGITFTIIYQFISMLFEFGGFHFNEYYDEKLADGGWIKVLIATLVGAFLYGFIISYGQFSSKLKKNKQEE